MGTKCYIRSITEWHRSWQTSLKGKPALRQGHNLFSTSRFCQLYIRVEGRPGRRSWVKHPNHHKERPSTGDGLGCNQRSSVLLIPSSSFGAYSDLLGMPDGHFQHELRGDFKEFWIIAVGLEEQRQDIKAPMRCLPPLLNADLQAKQRWG